ncbi:hypothetical protein MMC30_005445 [Trapelia coarctata]|nr:hypothetical protein [Trapelia coarctata]
MEKFRSPAITAFNKAGAERREKVEKYFVNRQRAAMGFCSMAGIGDAGMGNKLLSVQMQPGFATFLPSAEPPIRTIHFSAEGIDIKDGEGQSLLQHARYIGQYGVVAAWEWETRLHFRETISGAQAFDSSQPQDAAKVLPKEFFTGPHRPLEFLDAKYPLGGEIHTGPSVNWPESNTLWAQMRTFLANPRYFNHPRIQDVLILINNETNLRRQNMESNIEHLRGFSKPATKVRKGQRGNELTARIWHINTSTRTGPPPEMAGENSSAALIPTSRQRIPTRGTGATLSPTPTAATPARALSGRTATPQAIQEPAQHTRYGSIDAITTGAPGVEEVRQRAQVAFGSWGPSMAGSTTINFGVEQPLRLWIELKTLPCGHIEGLVSTPNTQRSSFPGATIGLCRLPFIRKRDPPFTIQPGGNLSEGKEAPASRDGELAFRATDHSSSIHRRLLWLRDRIPLVCAAGIEGNYAHPPNFYVGGSRPLARRENDMPKDDPDTSDANWLLNEFLRERYPGESELYTTNVKPDNPSFFD